MPKVGHLNFFVVPVRKIIFFVSYLQTLNYLFFIYLQNNSCFSEYSFVAGVCCLRLHHVPCRHIVQVVLWLSWCRCPLIRRRLDCESLNGALEGPEATQSSPPRHHRGGRATGPDPCVFEMCGWCSEERMVPHMHTTSPQRQIHQSSTCNRWYCFCFFPRRLPNQKGVNYLMLHSFNHWRFSDVDLNLFLSLFLTS